MGEQPQKEQPEPQPDTRRLRMAMHLNVLNANAALHRLKQVGDLRPNEKTMLSATEKYLGDAK